MTTDLEDRLRRALEARAAQVTPALLQPADPPTATAGHRWRRRWWQPVLVAAALVAVVFAIRPDHRPAPVPVPPVAPGPSATATPVPSPSTARPTITASAEPASPLPEGNVTRTPAGAPPVPEPGGTPPVTPFE